MSWLSHLVTAAAIGTASTSAPEQPTPTHKIPSAPSRTGVRGQAFFIWHPFQKRYRGEECLTGLPSAPMSAIESRPAP